MNLILRYTRLIGGNVSLSVEPCQLDDLCRVALRSIRPRAEAKQQLVEVNVEPHELTILSDGDGIAQTLQQLLDNAVKFTPVGGRIGLDVRLDDVEHFAHLIVWDSGIGISPEQQTTIFEPFRQVDATLARRFEGVGLGLAFVWRMVELLGGAIRVESCLGAGSRFIVTLPLQLAPTTGRLPTAPVTRL